MIKNDSNLPRWAVAILLTICTALVSVLGWGARSAYTSQQESLEGLGGRISNLEKTAVEGLGGRISGLEKSDATMAEHRRMVERRLERIETKLDALLGMK